LRKKGACICAGATASRKKGGPRAHREEEMPTEEEMPMEQEESMSEG